MIISDASYPDHSVRHIEDHQNRKDFYPETEEEISKDLPMPKGPKVRMTVNLQADHAHNLEARLSIIYCVVSKFQKALEISVIRIRVSCIKNSYRSYFRSQVRA